MPMNAVESILAESLEGFAAAHADLVKLAHGPTFVARRGAHARQRWRWSPAAAPATNRCTRGCVRYGMLDAACPGQVFTSPTPDQVLVATEAVDGGADILFIVKNDTGDVMNLEMPAEMVPGAQACVLTVRTIERAHHKTI